MEMKFQFCPACGRQLASDDIDSGADGHAFIACERLNGGCGWEGYIRSARVLSGYPLLPSASESCEQLGPFVDGELVAADAEVFRAHLVECPACQRATAENLELGGLARDAFQREAARVRPDEKGGK